MSNNKDDLELLNRISQGGDLTSSDTGADLSSSSNATVTLQEGTTIFKSEDKNENK